MSAGRPKIFETAEEMQKKIDQYFLNCPNKIKTPDGQEIPAPVISGLCYFLGFESRQSFYDYEKIEEFSYTIKRARLRIESQYEMRLHTNQCSGAIFGLKNFGWSDMQKIEHSGGIEIDDTGGIEESGQRIEAKLDRVLDGIGQGRTGKGARRSAKDSSTLGTKSKK